VRTNRIEDILQSSSIVGMPITLGSVVPDANNLGDVVVCVHGPSLAEDASAFEETPVLGDGGNVTLGITFRIVTRIDVSLDPTVDMGVAGGASEDRFTTDDADNSWNIHGPDVVEDDRRLHSGGDPRTSVEDGGVPDDSVDDSDSADTVNANLEPNLRVVDGNPLAGPPPVPNHSDSGVRAVDCDVSDGKLLIPDVETDISTVDNEVAHKTTTEDDLESFLGG